MDGGFAVFIIFLPWLVFMAPLAANFLLAPCGVVWSPLAAVICGIIARKRGLSSRRYAALGAMYSALFFFPWLYLVLRMLGRRIPHFLVVVFYIVVILGWFVAIVTTAWADSEAVDPFVPLTARILIALFSLVALLASLVWLVTKTEKPRPNFPPDSIWSVSLPDRGYIIPLLVGSVHTGFVFILIVFTQG